MLQIPARLETGMGVPEFSRLTYNGNDKVWIVKIDDLTGKYMYWIYAYDRHDAEQFIDAISNYVQKK